jgi:hypothetical protein
MEDMRLRSRLRHHATDRKVAVLNPDEVTVGFQLT